MGAVLNFIYEEKRKDRAERVFLSNEDSHPKIIIFPGVRIERDMGDLDENNVGIHDNITSDESGYEPER